MSGLLFVSQAMLDAWAEQGKIELVGSAMTVVTRDAPGGSHALGPAVRFTEALEAVARAPGRAPEDPPAGGALPRRGGGAGGPPPRARGAAGGGAGPREFHPGEALSRAINPLARAAVTPPLASGANEP